MKARGGERERGAVNRGEGYIREPNRRAKGMKGVPGIKSARSTVGRKGSRISLPLGRPLEIRKRFFRVDGASG